MPTRNLSMTRHDTMKACIQAHEHGPYSCEQAAAYPVMRSVLCWCYAQFACFLASAATFDQRRSFAEVNPSHCCCDDAQACMPPCGLACQLLQIASSGVGPAGTHAETSSRNWIDRVQLLYGFFSTAGEASGPSTCNRSVEMSELAQLSGPCTAPLAEQPAVAGDVGAAPLCGTVQLGRFRPLHSPVLECRRSRWST